MEEVRPRAWRVYVSSPPSRTFTSKIGARWYAWRMRRLGMTSSLYEAAEHGDWQLLRKQAP